MHACRHSVFMSIHLSNRYVVHTLHCKNLPRLLIILCRVPGILASPPLLQNEDHLAQKKILGSTRFLRHPDEKDPKRDPSLESYPPRKCGPALSD